MGSHQDLIWLQGRALESDLICAGGSCGTIHHSEGISQQWQLGGGDRGHRSMFDQFSVAGSQFSVKAKAGLSGPLRGDGRELSNSGCSFRIFPNQNWISRTMSVEKAWGMNGRKQKENLKPDIERSGTRHDQSFGSDGGDGRLGESRGIRKQRKQPRGLESERTRSGRHEVHFLSRQ
jgi:hypothetical protein